MTQHSARMLMILALLVLPLLTACSGLSNKQKTAASEAVSALKKIQAATQVGVNYQQYGMLVIEAKDKVNTAHAMLPEGQLKTELDAAMDAYTDAAQAWSIKFREFSTYLYAGEEPGKTLIPKYALKTFEHKRSVLNASGNIIRIDDQASLPDAALPLIWAAANMHVDRASSLLNQ
ncbi:MAG: hypothetical protein DMF64_03000 [Acidobacteria bacterium]|nr:MAG: hypothetical protein DMF64_03000 [Acidobacteriota bacterium]